jgi:ribose 5-phosphate isomerase B
MSLRIAIAADHGGFALKDEIGCSLASVGHTVINLGVDTGDSVDYPDKAHELADVLLKGKADFGILICGTGIGISIAANRHPGIRAAVCTNSYMAKMAREHNDANVLCLGARVIGSALAEDIVQAFLAARFQNGRHSHRLAKIELQ